MTIYLVASFNGADRPETEEYRRLLRSRPAAASFSSTAGSPAIFAHWFTLRPLKVARSRSLGRPSQCPAERLWAPEGPHSRATARPPQKTYRATGWTRSVRMTATRSAAIALVEAVHHWAP